jgi:hypothetical protein
MGQGRVYEGAEPAFGVDRSTGSNSELKLDLRPDRHHSGGGVLMSGDPRDRCTRPCLQPKRGRQDIASRIQHLVTLA